MKIKCQPFAAAVAVLAAAVIIAGVARGETETIDGFTWTYCINGDTAEIYGSLNSEGTGFIHAVSPEPEGAISIPTMLGGLPVACIGDNAFRDCCNLTHVTIPDSVTNIGYTAFNGCSKLSSLTIPNNVTGIGPFAFSECNALTNVVLGSGVSHIEPDAFCDCGGVRSFVVAADNPSYRSDSGLLFTKDGSVVVCGISGDIVIPDSVTYIGDYAFSGRQDLTSVTIPSSVTGIGYSSFSECIGLSDLVIPDNVQRIELYAFCRCGGLTNLTIGSSVVGIGSFSFLECTGLKYVTIPDSVTEIDCGAFSGCSNIVEFVVSEDNPAYRSDCGLLLTKDGSTVVCGVNGNVVIPDGVTFINEWAFEGYGGLTDITIPSNVTNIGVCAFRDCGALTNIVFLGDVPEIAEYAFDGLPEITECSPSDVVDVVLREGGAQQFTVSAHDPDGLDVRYVWTIDGEEVMSGIQATNLVFDSSDYMDNSCGHEIVCYVNDDFWTNVVHRKWMVYVPKEIHIDLGDNDNAYALQSAIYDSTPYDTIHVPAGWYVEHEIPHPLTIIADDGPTNTVIEGTISFDEYNWRTPGKVTLRGFTLTGKIDSMCYESVYSNLSLERCIIVNGGIDRDNWWEDENQDDDSYDEYEESDNAETVRCLFVNCSLDRCTVANNCVDPEILPLMANCVCSGTIVWGNEGAENDAQDPVFVSLSNGDYRLRTSSPYVANGIATRGALDDVVSGHVISASVVGPGSLDKMVATVEDGGSATFSVAFGSHPFDHFEVNGEPVVVPGNSYTFSNVASDATLTAFFVSNITFYVDAENGSDAADGFTKASAVASLQTAIDRTVNGDKILVADGVYASIETNAKSIIIESENGYRATIIDGGWTNRCVYAGGNGYGDFYWTDASTVLRGFTLRNGRSTFGGGAIGGTLERCLIVNCSATLPDVDDHYDLGNWASPFGVGGGAYDSTLFYCTVVGNIAEYWEGNEYSLEGRGGKGGGVYGCTLENCIVYGNEGVVAPDESNSECSSDSFVGVDPLFVNAANGDYRLMSNSPCVVAGVATAGCETEVVSGTMPELTSEQAESWVSEYLAVRYVKSGETAVDYQSRFEAKFGSDLVAAMAKPTDKKDAQGNAMYVWQDYVAGTDPTDTNSVFTAKINMVDGAPVISWEPELPPEQAALRTYTIYGKTNLTDHVWHSPTNSSSRFFRIGVELR